MSQSESSLSQFCGLLQAVPPGIVRVARSCWLALVCLIYPGCGIPISKPDAEATGRSDPSLVWFVDGSGKTQLTMTHHASGASRYFFPSIMGSGAAFIDYDNDDDLDIVLLDGDLSGTATNCRLFQQEEDGRLTEVTSKSGLICSEYAVGIAAGDVNNDGYPDLYVTCFGADHLFVNDRRGSFQDVTKTAGISNLRWGASVTLGDYDRDGWLDLFVTNYVDYDPALPCLVHNGQQDFCNPAMFPRTTDKLFHNVTGRGRASTDGRQLSPADVRFEDVSAESGIAAKPGAGLGVVCADFNADDWPDFYVANDGHGNFLWINQQNGFFREEAVLSGVAYDRLGKGQGSMGIAMGDLNSDQRLDMLVTNLDGESNALYLTLPSGGFEEASALAKISDASFPRTGFGTALTDIDLDGDLDLLVANGRVRRIATQSTLNLVPESPEFWSAYHESNDLFLNEGQGAFRLCRSDRDAFVKMNETARALVTGDYDNDGDVDLLVTSVNRPVRLLLNGTSRQGHWLIVRATLPECGGRDALGARVTVVCGKSRRVSVIAPGASYLSSHDPRLHFGLGADETIDAIEVVWPNGVRERFSGRGVDQILTLEQGRGESP